MRIDVLGVGFDNMTVEQAVAEGVRLLNTPGSHYAVTPNPEIVEVCREDGDAREAVNGADLVLADGIGIVYGAKMLGTPLKGRVTGIGFAQELMARMAENGKRLFLLGAKPGGGNSPAAVPRPGRGGDPRRLFPGGPAGNRGYPGQRRGCGLCLSGCAQAGKMDAGERRGHRGSSAGGAGRLPGCVLR